MNPGQGKGKFHGKRKAMQGLACALWAGVLLLAAGAGAQGRFAISAEGTQVSDSRTGLTWRRCSEGQSYGGGTCNGSASTFTHEAALAHARSQTGWRLPNVKELSSIVDDSRVGPAIDPTIFPATPSWDYWSSSPYVGYADYAWDVHLDHGHVGVNSRSDFNPIRLVR